MPKKKEPKMYLVHDPENADRIYTRETHGFSFTMVKDKTEEVSEELKEKLEAISPFLVFTEKGEQAAPILGVKMKGRKGRYR